MNELIVKAGGRPYRATFSVYTLSIGRDKAALTLRA